MTLFSHSFLYFMQQLPSKYVRFFAVNSDNPAQTVVYCNVYARFFIDFIDWLKNFTGFFFVLIDITAIDNFPLKPRFTLFYNFISLKRNVRVLVSVDIDVTELSEIRVVADLPYIKEYTIQQTTMEFVVNFFSSSYFFFSADWLEREVWDLFGVRFLNHFDLRRILNDYGFQGYPLRKDFPLIGFSEICFDLYKQYLIFIPVKLNQNVHTNNYETPWAIPKTPGTTTNA